MYCKNNASFIETHILYYELISLDCLHCSKCYLLHSAIFLIPYFYVESFTYYICYFHIICISKAFYALSL